uniref:Uncharacterized protein n=1 Tax=Meloidogyne hapla TaxID=6305 RepID=A0A1I8BD41_MELHA
MFKKSTKNIINLLPSELLVDIFKAIKSDNYKIFKKTIKEKKAEWSKYATKLTTCSSIIYAFAGESFLKYKEQERLLLELGALVTKDSNENEENVLQGEAVGLGNVGIGLEVETGGLENQGEAGGLGNEGLEDEALKARDFHILKNAIEKIQTLENQLQLHASQQVQGPVAILPDNYEPPAKRALTHPPLTEVIPSGPTRSSIPVETGTSKIYEFAGSGGGGQFNILPVVQGGPTRFGDLERRNAELIAENDSLKRAKENLKREKEHIMSLFRTTQANQTIQRSGASIQSMASNQPNPILHSNPVETRTFNVYEYAGSGGQFIIFPVVPGCPTCSLVGLERNDAELIAEGGQSNQANQPSTSSIGSQQKLPGAMQQHETGGGKAT